MPVTHPDANYSVLHLDTPDDWSELGSLCSGQLRDYQIERFRSALEHCCKTIVVERDYVCKDYRDTYTHYYSKKFAEYPSKSIRLLFFGSSVAPQDWWAVDAYKEPFIGYSIIRPTRTNCIGRTILDPEYCVFVDGVKRYLCLSSYKANLMGVDLEVKGFPYISQDTDVTICAHAALWMCFRYYSERYHAYREIYPYQITQLTSDLSGGRLLPSNGLYMEQIVEICSRYGFYPRLYYREHYQSDPDDPDQFERLLYTYIESGLPLVSGVPSHAIATIGHTLDLTRTVTSQIAFSSNYVSGLVVNDDNHLPYQYLPKDDVAPAHNISRFRMQDIDSFVVPLPEKVYLAAEDVEELTLALLNDPVIGLAATSKSLRLDDLVIRIFLTTSRSYKTQRRTASLPHNLSQKYTLLPMPYFIWVAELSTKSDYVAGNILGEIIWDATASDQDFYAWLVIHYPELLFINDRDSLIGGISEDNYSGSSPYELYRHNLQNVP